MHGNLQVVITVYFVEHCVYTCTVGVPHSLLLNKIIENYRYCNIIIIQYILTHPRQHTLIKSCYTQYTGPGHLRDGLEEQKWLDHVFDHAEHDDDGWKNIFKIFILI